MKQIFYIIVLSDMVYIKVLVQFVHFLVLEKYSNLHLDDAWDTC